MTEVRIVPVFRKANLTDSEFLQEIVDRIMVASKAYVSKLDNRILETKEEESECKGDVVNVRYVSRSEICMEVGGCSAVGEISLC
tara:strand:+ start:972 stop:1226 length:255 start_codon:yes stop_codon:yes gene_type:complete